MKSEKIYFPDEVAEEVELLKERVNYLEKKFNQFFMEEVIPSRRRLINQEKTRLE